MMEQKLIIYPFIHGSYYIILSESMPNMTENILHFFQLAHFATYR